MGPPREVVEISSDEDDEEEMCSGKLCVSPGSLGWIARLDESLAPVPRKKKGKSGGSRVGDDGDDDDDDCVILNGDPHGPVSVAGAKGRRAGVGASDEVEILAVKGEIACKDFPHSRHVCSEFPFGYTSHVKHCSMCYCFVCDAPAPCKYWGKGLSNDDHCHATDKETKWKTLRQAFKCKSLPASFPRKYVNVVYVSRPSPKEEDLPHSRHLCSAFPFSTTSHAKHCSMCYCYVCDAPAPCKYWGKGLSNNDHFHATDKEANWKRLRQSFKCKSLPASYSEKHADVVHPTTPPRQQEYYQEHTPEEYRPEDEEEDLNPDEEATVCVGNLHYGIDSEYLGQLFKYAGIVRFSEIIYDRETGLSCGYGYVTMSTVWEAENAVKNYHLRELYGRLITVSMAAAAASPSSSQAEETPPPFRSVPSSFKLYVGNLPWEVDGSELKELFSGYGEVVHAKILYNGRGAHRRSRGFGFVTMATKEGSEDAIWDLDRQVWRGRKLRVRFRAS